jgi:hypothetical protein
VRRHPSLKLKAQTLSASREILLRLRRPKILRSVALKLFSLSSVLILFAVYRKRLEAAPLLTTEQVEDSQIPFSGEETKLAAPGEIGTFYFSTERNSRVQRIIIIKSDLEAPC